MDVKTVAKEFQEIELEVFRETVPGATSKDGALKLAKLALVELRKMEGDDEITVEVYDSAFQRVAVAMATRYGLDVYRRPGMVDGEMIVLGPRTFVHTMYWVIVERMNRRLEAMFNEFAVEVLEKIGAPLPEQE